jgi:AcrR family transcriptional regulator
MVKNTSGSGDAARAEGNRRADLLIAAARLMREKGYAATTIRDMAGAVGMGSGSPFCHFRSKEEILGEIARLGMDAALTRAEALVAHHSLSARERLKALLHLHTDLLHGPDADFAVVMLREWRSLAPEARARLTAAMERYESIWRDCLHALPTAQHLSADTAAAARLILGSLNWSLHWFPHEAPPDTRQLADTVARIFLAEPTLGTA